MKEFFNVSAITIAALTGLALGFLAGVGMSLWALLLIWSTK